MSRFRNTLTGVVVSVDDSKDERFVDGWEPADEPEPDPEPEPEPEPAKKATPRKSQK